VTEQSLAVLGETVAHLCTAAFGKATYKCEESKLNVLAAQVKVLLK